MKPSVVLLLVLVAVGALIVAITQFGGDTETTTVADVGPQDTVLAPDPGDLAAPDSRPADVQPGQRAPAPKNPTDGSALATATDDDNELAGLVTGPAGEIVAGARLRLTRVSTTGFLLSDDGHDFTQDRVTESDADGNYIFKGIEPFERYVIVATHEMYSRTEVTNVNIGDRGTFTEMVILLPGNVFEGFVFDEGKNPVPGALLQLDGAYGPESSAQHDDRLTTTSDDTGHYMFPNSTVGHHALTVSADGYGNQTIRGLQFIDGKGPNKRNVYLMVAERISGRVVGPDGAGIEDVQILAVSVSNQNKQCRNEVVSQAEGLFDIGALSPGKYTLVAKKEGYRLERNHRVDTGTSDVLLQMRRLSLVTGNVFAPDGLVPTSYEVRLRRAHANTDQTTETNIKAKFSNNDGSFELNVPADGTYVVEARAKDYAPTFSQMFRIKDGGDYDGVTVNMVVGGIITGTVVSSTGEPLAGAVVTTHMNDFMNDEFDAFLGSMNATSVKVRTNNEGKFRIQGLRPDTYQLRVKSSGHVELIKKDIAVRENLPNELGSLRMSMGGTVRGLVYDPRREVASGIHVTLTSDTRGSNDIARTYKSKTDATGNFVFPNIAAGSYLIRARDPNVGLDGDFGALIRDPKANMSRRIIVSEGQEVKYDLKL